jgi:hypothetical protein
LPTLWFRNTWTLGYDNYDVPSAVGNIGQSNQNKPPRIRRAYLAAEGDPDLLFCGNETNTKRFNNFDDGKRFYKDGINDHIIHGAETVNPEKTGTKAAANYDITIPAKGSIRIELRLSDKQENGF